MLRRIASLACAGLLVTSCASAANATENGTVKVSLSELVRTQKVVGQTSEQRLMAAVKIENNSGETRCISGYDNDGFLVLQLGVNGKIDFLEPSYPKWQITAGAGPGAPPHDAVCVKQGADGIVYIDWPLEFLTDYPAETRFRITVVDQSERAFSSEPFRLHDGILKLREVYLRR